MNFESTKIKKEDFEGNIWLFSSKCSTAFAVVANFFNSALAERRWLKLSEHAAAGNEDPDEIQCELCQSNHLVCLFPCVKRQPAPRLRAMTSQRCQQSVSLKKNKSENILKMQSAKN